MLASKRTHPNTRGGSPESISPPKSTMNGAMELPTLLTNSRKLNPKFLKAQRGRLEELYIENVI